MTFDLAALGYRRAARTALWSPQGAPDFGYNDGDEHETWVADVVRSAKDTSSGSRELEAGIRDWPSLYHLSHQRGNLVRPLLPALRGPVLELGAGTGAITRVLGEHGLDVVAVEGSPRRAAIAADRCRDLPNVQVVADTVQGFGHPARFATVVMVGVLEYARMFGFETTDTDPVDVMLEHVARLLLPDGELVVAIENQLGLKYFAGFPEDHLGQAMAGVEDRYGSATAVTFGRQELGARLRGAGLVEQRWLFPFPDYKLPTTVVTERALDPASGFDATPLLVATGGGDHQEPETTSFDLRRAWGPVHRNDLVPDLSNSFLVRASVAALPEPSTLAWYYGSGARRPEFRKVTEFVAGDGRVDVLRRRAEPDLRDTVRDVQLVCEDEPYAPVPPWTAELADRLARPGWTSAAVVEWFGPWLDAIRTYAGLPAGSTDLDAEVPGHLVDALPRNLLSGTGRFIDLEWRALVPPTLGWVLFRALYDSLAALGPVAPPEGPPPTVGDLVREVAAAHGFVLDEARLTSWWDLEVTFQSVVQGTVVRVPVDDALDVALRIAPSHAALAPTPAPAVEPLVPPALETELREEIEARGRELDRLRGVAELAGSEISRAGEARERLASAFGRLERDAEVLRREATDGAQRLASAQRDADVLRAELDAYVHTLSWRVTWPLRAARGRAARTRHAMARRMQLRRGGTTPTASGAGVPGGAPAPERTWRRRATDVDGPAVVAPGAGHAPDVAVPEPDLTYYRRRNDDLRHLDDAELRRHFTAFGRAEGRRGHSLLDTARITENGFAPGRERMLLLLHEATRTGAPVLGWNLLNSFSEQRDVVVVLLQGGDLSQEIERAAAATVTLVEADPWHPAEAQILAEQLVERFGPTWALANSAATHPLAPALEATGVPVVALVHEFPSSMRPEGVLGALFATVSEVVFSAPIVADSMRREYADLIARPHHVIPQGQSLLPAGSDTDRAPRPMRRGSDGVETELPEHALADLLADLDASTVLVVGAGTISPRKGVEFFVQTADQVRRSGGEREVRFAWIGDRHPSLNWYVDELHEQVRRSGADDVVSFLAPTSDLTPLYERADLFFLSSRLDPLPNVTIDAALSGTPIVAFDGASGFAEWLGKDDLLRELVVPHLDTATAAATIRRLADDAEGRLTYGDRLRAAAAPAFDMAAYTARLAELGGEARAAHEQEQRDVAALVESGAFDAHLYGGAGRDADPLALLQEYVHRSRLTAPRARPRTGLLVRRPAEGFHPLVYAEQSPDYVEARDGDPFVDYLRRGRPDGPWALPVVRPSASPAATDLRVLVHGHFHYPELVDELLERMGGNAQQVDLRLSTTSEHKEIDLRRRLERAGAERWQVDVVENRGRDLAPLFTGLGHDVLDGYDLVLHVHGKRSPHVAGDVADRWRTFLWENLVGGSARMMDTVCAAFAADERLGLVAPEDPHLNDWDLNRDEGERLAKRLGLTTPLTTHLDFPMGGMFWARTDALRPLLDAQLQWEEYPAEPLPIDGTMLHALERIIPFAVEQSGYRFAKTSVPGVSR
ncbi:rhamnan synthesis F family protein [Cellulomonas sp. S1-8]|uniref:rhamnan synthesis F family protein n=1 Tax=Cellulomonas sp. S1-8 TaxID=2904790 RepID=UPI0022431547|nr:rhamnan synthesis F family protein [Cellulomonas sp. S1-8]UZN01918.1 glycosyltransferase [Cellulomonas sp. S1-8]